MKPTPFPGPTEQYLTVAQVAQLLNLSRDTVLRRFAGLPGVVDLGHEETRTRRGYRLLRIPAYVLARFLRDHGARGSVHDLVPAGSVVQLDKAA